MSGNIYSQIEENEDYKDRQDDCCTTSSCCKKFLEFETDTRIIVSKLKLNNLKKMF